MKLKILALICSVFLASFPRRSCCLSSAVGNAFTLYKDGVNSLLPGPSISFNKSLTMGSFQFKFKTFVEKALVLYQDSEGNSDFIELYLQEGRIHFIFSDERNLERKSSYVSQKVYSDFEWHLVRIERNSSRTSLALDNKIVKTFETYGLNLIFTSNIQIGGFPPSRYNSRNSVSNQAALRLYASPNRKKGFFHACVGDIRHGSNLDSMQPIEDIPSLRYYAKKGNCTLMYCGKDEMKCKNQGKAICTTSGKANVMCDCKKTGYEGTNCTQDINECKLSPSVCHNLAQCRNTKGSHECQCASGYTGDGKTNCTDINECKQSPSGCHYLAQCRNTKGSYECQCPSGFTGDGKINCTDINECHQSPGVCHYHAQCRNTKGSFKCQCASGYTGDGKINCTSTGSNNVTLSINTTIECNQSLSDCHYLAQCRNTSYQCECASGYTGDGKTNCTDINECNQSPSVCHYRAQCRNTKGSFKCQCSSGYIGDGQTNCTKYYENERENFPSKACDKFPCFPGLECSATNNGYICEKCPNLFDGNGQDCTLRRISEKNVLKSTMILTNEEWQHELKDKTSKTYRKLASRVIKEIRKVYSDHPEFSYIIIKEFRQGSVVVEFELIFTKPVNNPLEPLSQAIKSTKLGNMTIEMKMLAKKRSDDKETILGLDENMFIGVIIAAAVLLIVLVGFAVCIFIRRKRTTKNATLLNEQGEEMTTKPKGLYFQPTLEGAERVVQE